MEKEEISAPKYMSLNLTFSLLEIEYKNVRKINTIKSKKIGVKIVGILVLDLNRKLLKKTRKISKNDKNTSRINDSKTLHIFCLKNLVNFISFLLIFEYAKMKKFIPLLDM